MWKTLFVACNFADSTFNCMTTWWVLASTAMHSSCVRFARSARAAFANSKPGTTATVCREPFGRTSMTSYTRYMGPNSFRVFYYPSSCRLRQLRTGNDNNFARPPSFGIFGNFDVDGVLFLQVRITVADDWPCNERKDPGPPACPKKPYPFELLNHFTFPCTLVCLTKPPPPGLSDRRPIPLADNSQEFRAPQACYIV